MNDTIYKGGNLGKWGIVMVGTIIIAITGVLKNGFIIALFHWASVVMLVALIIYFIAINKYTYLKITKDGKLYRSAGLELYMYKTMDIHDILKIERYATTKMKSTGSSIVIRYKDKKGKIKTMQIEENDFETKVIKKFLKDLKKINPGIILDQQYEDLLSGKYADNDFQKIEAIK